MSKRKSVYREQFSTDFPGIKNSKKVENYAFCEYCSTVVNIANAGVSSIKQHFEKEVHKNNVKIKKSTVGISTFFHSNNLPTSRKTAVAEGAFAYHVAFHSLSFKAADCTNRLISTVFAESETGRKFSSAQTKTQAIISRILAPKSIENLLSELGSEPFSIATDSSNFKEIKTFPIIIRYFSHEVLKVELLEFSNLPGETSELIFKYVMTVLDRFKLGPNNLVAFKDSNLANRIEKEFSTFYLTSVDYIQKWFRITDYPSSSKWLMLKSVDTISYEDIRKSAEFLMPEISVKDSLFDETSLLISLLKDSKESPNLPIFNYTQTHGVVSPVERKSFKKVICTDELKSFLKPHITVFDTALPLKLNEIRRDVTIAGTMHPFKFIFGTLLKILNGISTHSIWSNKAISMIDSVVCQSRNSGNVRISGPLTLINMDNSTRSTNYLWVVSYPIGTELAMEVEPAVWFVQRHICSSAAFLELYKRITFPQTHVIPDDSNPCCIAQSTAFCFEFMAFVSSIDDKLLTAGKFMTTDKFKMSKK
ncbi:hypothetical protein HELRODRAFT_162055 [Helobdella robusta]|uniref:Uncharacterized protein n=1 Tax=Helobdella robusta TaxID=6412 RepID=T1ES72_HELRO|nr:hypothetical protein HELRODRAFT_162055 [Helobdella robusta]ESN98619.1 hypothetical protein HELRODRAFT_162055 [Helobdella robusta]